MGMAQEGVVFKPNSNIGVDISVKDLRRENDSVLLALGATRARSLEITGHNLKGIHQAMEFLTKNTRSLLATNGNELQLPEGSNISAAGKNVVVIGGGDTGTDCIATSLRHGCKSIINFELLPQPPNDRDDSNPWPEWPRIYRVDYGHSEGKEQFGRDPREYCVMSKEFFGDAEGNVSAVKTVQVEWTAEQPEDLGLKP